MMIHPQPVSTISRPRGLSGRWRWRLMGWWMCATLGLPGGVHAQPAAAPPSLDLPPPGPPVIPLEPAEGEQGDAVPIELELDLSALMRRDEVLPASVEDTIWKIEAPPGRRLLQVPLIFKPGQKPYELRASSVRVRNGRILAWRVNEPLPSDILARAGAEALGQPPAEVPENLRPPTLTRALSVTPEGRIRWRMDRTLNNATMKETSLYSLKISQELLNRQSPGNPPRTLPNPGERPQDVQARRVAAEAEYRARANAFRDLTRQVRELPDSFEAPLPPIVWAVFEVRDSTLGTPLAGSVDVQLDGPPPLPWSVPADAFEALRVLRQPIASPDGQGIPADVRQRIDRLAGFVAKSDHPYTLRLAAQALAASRAIAYARPEDSVYELSKKILTGSDVWARILLARELASVVPPTQATVRLLEIAARDADPRAQLASLRGLMRSSPASTSAAGSAGRAQAVTQTANRILADPRGPDVLQVMEELVTTAGEQPDVVPVLVSQVRFDAMPEDRRRSAIAYVIGHAGDSPLCAAWLDQRLLGEADARIVRQTLDLMATARSSDDVLQPLAGLLLDAVFGPPPINASAGASALVIPRPIPVDSPSHGLFKALQHGNPEVRALAWQSLRFFLLRAPGSAAAPGQSDMLRSLTDAALTQSPTPLGIIPFLKRQARELPVDATVQLARLAADADPAAASAALRSLRGSRLPLDQAMPGLSPIERQRLAERTAQVFLGATIRTGPLMRHAPEGQLAPAAAWFADQMMQGRVPASDAWLAAAGGEQALIDLAQQSPDNDLAVAAASALAASVGGDDSLADRLLAAIRTPAPAGSAPIDHARAAWSAARREALVARLAAAAGPHGLSLRVYAAPNPDDPNAPRPAPPQPGPTDPGEASAPPSLPSVLGLPQTHIDLGTIDLAASQGQVTLGNQTLTASVPDAYLAIRLDKPIEIKNIPRPELADLPLDQLPAPLILLPRKDGSWLGRSPLPDGRMIEVALSPVR